MTDGAYQNRRCPGFLEETIIRRTGTTLIFEIHVLDGLAGAYVVFYFENLKTCKGIVLY